MPLLLLLLLLLLPSPGGLSHSRPAPLAVSRRLAEHGEPISPDEAAAVVAGVRTATLHADYVSVAGNHCAPCPAASPVPAYGARLVS